MNLIETLERLAKLRAKATAGPWESPGIYTGSVFPMPSVSSSWVLGDGKPCDAAFVAAAGSADFPAILATVREKDAEVERLRKCLSAAHDENWTASLCDRLNEIVRENASVLPSECRDGPSASDLIRVIHGKFNEYRARNAELEGENARLREVEAAAETLLAYQGNRKEPECWDNLRAALASPKADGAGGAS